MQRWSRAVAIAGNGSQVLESFLRPSPLRAVDVVCVRSAPQVLHDLLPIRTTWPFGIPRHVRRRHFDGPLDHHCDAPARGLGRAVGLSQPRSVRRISATCCLAARRAGRAVIAAIAIVVAGMTANRVHRGGKAVVVLPLTAMTK